MSFQVLTQLTAEALTGNTQVSINLSNNGTAVQRVAINEVVTFAQLGINPKTAAAAEPSFADTQTQITALSRRNDLSGQDKAAQITALMAEYTTKVAEFKAAGNVGIVDRVMAAVVQWLINTKGFSASGQAGKQTIKASDLQVSAIPTPHGDYVFNVVGTSVWG
jgi:hypothetical protein